MERRALEARIQAIAANKEVVDRDVAELEQPAVDPQELALREARIVLAEATLNQAIEDLAELMEDLGETPDSLELELNTRQLELAQATLVQLHEDYNQLLDDRKVQPDPVEVALRGQQITLAEASVVQAEESLAELLAEQGEPPDPLDVALAEQKIVAAGVRLTTAEEELEAAVITAPIGGYVSVVNVELGDSVEARAAVLEIVDPTIVEVDGIVDEIDVLLVSVGTSAEVSLDALPGVQLERRGHRDCRRGREPAGRHNFPHPHPHGGPRGGPAPGGSQRRGQHRAAGRAQRPPAAATGPVRFLRPARGADNVRQRRFRNSRRTGQQRRLLGGGKGRPCRGRPDYS